MITRSWIEHWDQHSSAVERLVPQVAVHLVDQAPLDLFHKMLYYYSLIISYLFSYTYFQ